MLNDRVKDEKRVEGKPMESITFSKLVVSWLLRLDHRIQTRGFKKRLLKAVANDNDEYTVAELKEDLGNDGPGRT